MAITVLPARFQVAASSLASLGVRPYLLTGIFVQMLRQHFADLQNIVSPSLSGFTWTSSPDSPVRIESADVWDPDKIDNCPALIVTRNDWKQERIGIGNRFLGGDNLDGTEYFSKMMVGSHTITAIDRSGAAAETIAFEAYSELGRFADVIRRDLCFHRFDFESLGSLKKLKEGRDEFAAPMLVSYAALESWSIRSDAPLLKTFDFQVQQ